jgi:integrase
MSKATSPSRRQRVEPGIYGRTGADGRTAYEIGWRDVQGRQRWRRVEGGIKAARAALAEAHAARGRGERVATDPRLRFHDAAQAWWDARVVRLRPATQSAYGAGLAHLRDRFGRARMADITPADVAAFIAAQQRAGLKGWTIKGQLTVLSSIFTYAARHLGLVGVNPVSLLDRVERPSSEDERPKRVLSPDELRRLLDAVDEPYRLVFELAAETGGRLAEALGLVWGEVDLDEQTVTFTHQLDRRGQRVPLKTKRSRRCVEVTPALVSKLRAARVAVDRSGPRDLVFVTRNLTGHDHRNIGGRVLARAVKRAGLEAVKRDGQVVEHAPTFHSLRHSHGSALIAAGWDIEEVSARLGHSDVGTTQRAYVHAYDAARRSAGQRDRLALMYGSVEADVEARDGSSGEQARTAAGATVLQMS